jgi:hypothetical protein
VLLLHAEPKVSIRVGDGTGDLYPLWVSPWPACNLLVAEVSTVGLVSVPDVGMPTAWTQQWRTAHTNHLTRSCLELF